MDIGFWNADIVTGAVRGADGFFRIMGLSRNEDLKISDWTSLLHPEDQEDFRSLCSIVTMGVSASREVRLIERGRQPRWIRIAAEQSAETGRLIGLVEDLAAEREAKAALYRERARLNAYLNIAEGVFWAADLSGAIVDFSGWEAITGQPQENCRSHGWTELIHPEDREQVMMTWATSFRDGIPFESPYRLRYADGVYRRVRSCGIPVLQENGKPIEWFGVVQEAWQWEAGEPAGGAQTLLTSQQLRAARAMLDWSTARLAEEAGVSSATIRRYEATDEHMKETTIAAIISVLERQGITLTHSLNDIGLKLRTKKP
ncbi:PAS domain-containing protein [Shinella sp.]|uniref:PAS domain-containing protein n=1 Tax=Shinella sp. TaxID=1870904 RepID=UPI003F6F80DD